MKHNLKTISFMIASFKDIVNTFGMNEKSIAFFKKNIEGLSAISQVTPSDINLIYDVLNFNDKNISPEKRISFLNEYVKAINKVHTVKNKYDNSDWKGNSKYLPKKDSYIYSDEDEFDEEIKYFLNLDK